MIVKHLFSSLPHHSSSQPSILRKVSLWRKLNKHMIIFIINLTQLNSSLSKQINFTYNFIYLKWTLQICSKTKLDFPGKWPLPSYIWLVSNVTRNICIFHRLAGFLSVALCQAKALIVVPFMIWIMADKPADGHPKDILRNKWSSLISSILWTLSK